jgi:IclR family acetate operon transcriptional repressor
MTLDLISAGRLFDVIELVAREGICSLQTISSRTQISFSAVHRIAQTLIERGYLVATQRGSYCLGPAAICLGQAISQRDLLCNAARPIVAALSRACRAHAHLGIFEGDMVTYLVKSAYGRRDIFSVEGTQLEAYCTALGKILLAHLPAAEMERYLSRGEFIALTPATITDADKLSEELALVRSRGWAMDDEEVMPGLRCIAMPVSDASGSVIAAVSVSVRSRRFDAPALAALRHSLSNAAKQIAGKLGLGKDLILPKSDKPDEQTDLHLKDGRK